MISALFRDVSFYGVASVLARSVTLLTFPMLARHLSIEEYGFFDLFYTTVAVIITLFMFGQDSSLLRYFHDEQDDARAKLVTQTVIFQTSVAIVFLFLIWFSKDFILGAFDASELAKILQFNIIIIPFGVFYTISEVILRLTFDAKGFLLLTLGFVLCTLSMVFIGLR